MILSLVGRSDAILRVRDSRFLARAFPADSEEEARERIADAEREHPDATHHCYAFRLGADGSLERAGDAGEPAGSAGPPILAVIRGRGLTNVGVVVSRYFGGTKVGIGGLARAYRDAARAALDAGTVQERPLRHRVGVAVPLALVGETQGLLARLGIELLTEHYGDTAELRLAVGEEVEEEFRRRLDDLTRGAARWSE